MKLRFGVTLFVVLGWLGTAAQKTESSESRPPSGEVRSSYVPMHKYDPKRDAAADFQAAISGTMLSGPLWINDALAYLPADFLCQGTLFLTFGYGSDLMPDYRD